MNESVGTLLQKQRLAHHLSLDDMHAKTKLSVRLLKALEADDRGAFPGDIYYIGAIKTCARMLGLDPAGLSFQAKASIDAQCAPAAPAAEPVVEPPRPERISVVRIVMAVVALSAALAVLLLSRCQRPSPANMQYELQAPSSAPVAKAAPAEPKPVVPEPPAPRLPSERTAAAGTQAPALKLDIVTASDSWIKVVADDMTAYQAIMRAGARQAWDAARSFRVVVGYTPGISTMTVNGIPVDLSPAASGIAELFISTDGIKVGTITPEKSPKKSTHTLTSPSAPQKRPQ